MAYLGLGAAMIGLAVSMMAPTSDMIENLIGKAINRGLLFQAVAILAIVNHGIVKKNLETVQENKRYVQGIIKRFENEEGVGVDQDGDLPNVPAQVLPRNDKLDASGVTLPRAQILAQNKATKKFVQETIGVPCPGGFIKIKDGEQECSQPDLTTDIVEDYKESDIGQG